MRNRIRIILNPISGSGRARRMAQRLEQELGSRAELAETQGAGDAKRLAAEAAGCGAVAGLGGDGTVNEILNGLPEKDAPPLAMIPCGTANVLAKELGLPRTTGALARVLESGPERLLDLGVDRESGRKFLLFLTAGFDAHVVHVFHAIRKGPISMWHYIYWGLRSLFRFPFPAMTVELDGIRLTDKASWVHISNVASYGGPLVFTPHARPDDGRFEVMVLERGRHVDTVWMFARAILAWALGANPSLRGLSFHSARRVRLASNDGSPVPIQVDGDPGGHLPVDAEVVPASVRVIVPTTRTAPSSSGASSG